MMMWLWPKWAVAALLVGGTAQAAPPPDRAGSGASRS